MKYTSATSLGTPLLLLIHSCIHSANHLAVVHCINSCRYRLRASVIDHRKIVRRVYTHWKANLTQTNTFNHHGKQKIISECTACWTLGQMNYNSRRPLSFDSDQPWKRIWGCTVHWNWRLEIKKKGPED